MAKTESTAVNELIELMQNNKQPASEPAADLFTAAPQGTKVNPPRMTSPVPPMRGAGEVEPLPRGRAPQSTSELAMKPHVRMSTADPERGNTIPPLSRPTPPRPTPSRQTSSLPTLPRNAAVPPAPRKTPRATGAQRISTQAPAQRPPSQPPAPPQQRASSQPPVPPNLRPSQQETLRPGSMPALPAPRASQGSLPTVPVERVSSPRTAMQMPIPAPPPEVAAPIAAASPIDIDATPLPPPYQELDLTPPLGELPFQTRPTVPSAAALPLPVPQQFPIISAASNVATPDWLAVPKRRKTERSEGTAVVMRQPQSDTFALIKKLIAPTIILAIIGVMVGGFFAFDGQGGKKKKAGVAAAATPDTSARVAMPVVAAQEAPKAAQPEPPTKAEQVENVEAARAAAANESMIPAATSAAIGATAPTPTPTPAKAPAPAVAAAAPAPAPAPAPAAAPAPAPVAAVAQPVAVPTAAPGTVREVRTLKGMVKLVDVRIDSNPAGAEVMLVDKGKTSFLGTTPLATSVDASRTYDLIFTIPGRPTKMAPLDPSKSTKVDVRIHRGASAKKDAEPAKLGASFIDETAAKPTAAPAKAEPKVAAPAKPDKKEAAGEGTLMVSSKPPCEIIIDGKPTGLTTPQRSITLSAGPHKITFVNASEGINKTVSVTIVADQATKLIQDLMNK